MNKNFISLYLLILFIISNIKSKSIDSGCFFIDTNSLSFFSIYALSSKVDYNYTVDNNNKTMIFFNFCSVLKNGNAQVILQVFEKNFTNTTILSKNNINENKWKSDDDGIKIELDSGEKCMNENYSITYDIKCNKDFKETKDGQKFEIIKFYSDTCKNILEMESKYGCPQASIYNFWKFIHENKKIFSLVLAGTGIILCFFGKKFLYLTIFLFSTIAFMAIFLMFLFNVFLPKGLEIDKINIIIVLVISFVPGIGLGIFIIKFQKFLLACILGGIGGFFLSVFVYDLILIHFDFANKSYMKIIIFIAIIAICIGIGYLSVEHLKIISTSFVGAYLLVRAPTLFITEFPNESELADYFEDKEKIRELGKYVLLKLIVFLICWIFFSCIGIYVQYKMWGIKDGKDGDTKSSSVKGDPALDDTFFETHN
jgi:hypothetical protein